MTASSIASASEVTSPSISVIKAICFVHGDHFDLKIKSHTLVFCCEHDLTNVLIFRSYPLPIQISLSLSDT